MAARERCRFNLGFWRRSSDRRAFAGKANFVRPKTRCLDIDAPPRFRKACQRDPSIAARRHSHFVPSADLSRCSKVREPKPGLFDYLVGTQQERLGDRNAERLRGSEVDDKIEFNCLFHWKIRRFRAVQNPINVAGSASE